MKMMEKAGYAKRGESDAGEEWITIDEDGSDLTKDKMKDAVAGYVRELVLFSARRAMWKGGEPRVDTDSLPPRASPESGRVGLRCHLKRVRYVYTDTKYWCRVEDGVLLFALGNASVVLFGTCTRF